MARDDPYAAFGRADDADDPYANLGRTVEDAPREKLSLRPTGRKEIKPFAIPRDGTVHDGDTFRADGKSNRLQGVDAFEMDQTGRTLTGESVPLGQQARSKFQPFTLPGATITPTGKAAYNRQAVTVSRGGQDAGEALVSEGLALPVPRYLAPEQRDEYIPAQREAIASERGAYGGQYQVPADFRKQGDAAPITGKILMDAEQAAQWENLVRNPVTTPAMVGDWLRTKGHSAENVSNVVRFLSRNPQAEANPAFQQRDAEGNPVQPEPRGLFLRSMDALNEGVVDIVATPFELSHALGKVAGGALGVDMAETSPIAGWLRDKAHAAGLGQRDEGSAPRSDLERYGQAFMRGTGSALIPVGGTIGAGSRLATRAPSMATQASAGRTVLRDSLTDAAKAPGTAAALEVGAGAGSYIGEEVANDVAPGNPYAAVAGSVLGGLGGGFAGGIGARRMGARSSGDTVAPAGAPDRPAADFDPSAPMVERDGQVFARAADGREVAIPVDPSGHPGVTWAGDHWEALVEVQSDGTPGYGPQDGPNTLASRYGDLTRQLNGSGGRPMGAPDEATPPPVGNAGNAAETLPPAAPPAARPTVIDGPTLRASASDQSGEADMARAGEALRSQADEALARGDSVVLHSEGRAIPITQRGMVDAQGQQWGAMPILTDATGKNRLEITPRAEAMDGGAGRQELVGPAAAPAPRQRDVIDVNARARPLLDDATDYERLRAAERLNPQDVLPIPASQVADMDEAARIDRGRYVPERAGDPRKELETRGYRSPKNGLAILRRKGPPDLVTWLRSEGGLKLDEADAGEFRHVDIDNTPRNLEFAKGEGQLGKLLDDERGMELDYAAMRAWEAGYFPDLIDRPTINEFMDALVATHRGGTGRVFHPDDLPELDRYREATMQRDAVEMAKQEGAPLIADRSVPASLEDMDANAAPVEAYMEWGENAPDFAGNIRLDGLDSPQEIKRALTQVERATGGFDAARRGRITQAETASLAADLNMTPKQLLARRKGVAFNAEEALAARQLLAKSGNELVNMAKRIKRGEATERDMVTFRAAVLRHAAIQEQVSGMTAEAGRTLQQFRQIADARAVKAPVMRDILDTMGGVDGAHAAAEMIIDQAGDPRKLNANVKQLTNPKLKDKILELWYNSILSGPATHAVNILSNTLTTLSQIPEHGVAAGVGKVRSMLPGQAGTDRVVFDEVRARTAGLLAGTSEGLKQARRTFKTGEPSDFASKVEAQSMKAIGGKKGEIVRIPSRFLAAEDEFFKAIARRQELYGLAVRKASQEGLTGDAFKARAAELIASPTEDMLDRAFDFGRYVTFQRPLSSGHGVSQWTQNMVGKVWPAKFILPFIRTPTNLLKYTLERSPAAPLVKEWRKDFMAGGAKRDIAIARFMVGTGIMASVFQLAQEGLITGGGPADESAKGLLRADGWQPYSFRVGDKYYSYQRLDPFASTIGVAADLVELQSHMTEEQRRTTTALLIATTLKNLSNKVWLANAADAVEALNDPGRYGEQFAARLAGSAAVPTIVAQTARVVDPVLREARSPMDRIRSRIPGLSSSLKPRRDVLGREIATEGGVGPDIASPLWTSTRKNGDVANALLDLGVSISKPQRTLKVGGKSVELTAEQYDDYQAVTGDILRAKLTDFIRSPEWQAMTVAARKKEAGKMIPAARREARGILMLGTPPGKRSAAPALPPGLAGMPDPYAAYGLPAN